MVVTLYSMDGVGCDSSGLQADRGLSRCVPDALDLTAR